MRNFVLFHPRLRHCLGVCVRRPLKGPSRSFVLIVVADDWEAKFENPIIVDTRSRAYYAGIYPREDGIP